MECAIPILVETSFDSWLCTVLKEMNLKQQCNGHHKCSEILRVEIGKKMNTNDYISWRLWSYFLLRWNK